MPLDSDPKPEQNFKDITKETRQNSKTEALSKSSRAYRYRWLCHRVSEARCIGGKMLTEVV